MEETDNRRGFIVSVTSGFPKRLADRGVKLSFTTQQEISPEDLMHLDRLGNKNGWLKFVENPAEKYEFNDGEIPKENAPVHRGKKSGRQRLRAILWVLHGKLGGKPEDFEDYYEREYEYICSQYKETLEQLENG